MDIAASLDRWRASHDEGSRKLYEFSEAWNRFEDTMWAEYANLESRREASSVPRRSWQLAVETDRGALEECKRRMYKPWNEKLMRFCPLWLCLDQKDVASSEYELERLEYPWRAALSFWARFDERCENDAKFRQSLSPSQLYSYELLRDWWQARYCDNGLVETTKAYMERLGKHRFPSLEINANSDQALKDADPIAMTNKLRYEYCCFKLFVHEFHPDEWGPYIANVSIHLLVAARRNAAQCAIAQRLSFPIISQFSRAASPAGEGQYPRYPQISLNAITPSQGLPYYLWDTEYHRTIETRTLASHPIYVCISHTWGRWVDKTKPPFIIFGVPWPVPRVRPERFDVRKLPQELKKLKHRYVWIDLFCIPQTPKEPWTSMPKEILAEWTERANKEIGRQSSIFHGSSRCIAWLNDISSWNETNLALRWTGVRFLKITGFLSDDFSHGTVLEPEKPGFIEYEASPNENETFRGLKPRIKIGWFTSLWTLQEAVLCPDMELFTADWTQLMDSWGSPISLRSMMVFLNFCWRLDDWKLWPEGPMELSKLETLSDLATVFITESPTAICSITNTRTCSGPPQDRAPAIMSAIGVTDWWESRDNTVIDQFGEEELLNYAVLNSYPLGFLQEAAQKIGAAFYHTTNWGTLLHDETTREMIIERSKLGTKIQDVQLQDEFTRRHNSKLGTMLPFKSPGSPMAWATDSFPKFPHTNMEDHPSVSSWHICSDGSVRILQAGILLSTAEGSSESEMTTANITCSQEMSQSLRSKMQGTNGRTDLDLAVALRVLGGNGKAYAVALYTEGSSHYGVILLGPKCEESSTEYLVKLGIYSTVDVRAPDASMVDWVVL